MVGGGTKCTNRITELGASDETSTVHHMPSPEPRCPHPARLFVCAPRSPDVTFLFQGYFRLPDQNANRRFREVPHDKKKHGINRPHHEEKARAGRPIGFSRLCFVSAPIPRPLPFSNTKESLQRTLLNCRVLLKREL